MQEQMSDEARAYYLHSNEDITERIYVFMLNICPYRLPVGFKA